MVARTHLPLVLAVFCLTAATGIFLLSDERAEPTTSLFFNDEAFYAEVPAVSLQFMPNTASSTSSAGKLKLPILVYHIVRPSYPSDSRAVRAIAHTPEVFDAQMEYLHDAGYHVVSFHELESHFKNGIPLPDKPIIISFDDGWDDQFTYAFPVLEKYKYTATFFVFTNPIGTKGFMTWDELRAMQKAGMTIASHSRSHPYLTRITDPKALRNEISGSKQVLESRLGITVREFAYPFGQYNAAVMAAVTDAGYLSARGDRYYRGEQAANRLYELDALNAPTTMALFERMFPAH